MSGALDFLMGEIMFFVENSRKSFEGIVTQPSFKSASLNKNLGGRN